MTNHYSRYFVNIFFLGKLELLMCFKSSNTKEGQSYFKNFIYGQNSDAKHIPIILS